MSDKIDVNVNFKLDMCLEILKQGGGCDGILCAGGDNERFGFTNCPLFNDGSCICSGDDNGQRRYQAIKYLSKVENFKSLTAVLNDADNGGLAREPAQPEQPVPVQDLIKKECDELATFLIEKNKSYGNSAFEPLRMFAKRVAPLAQIDVRIDDKLNRLIKGEEFIGDDTIRDLTGYLVLRRVAEKLIT